jgi:hypothetical protein
MIRFVFLSLLLILPLVGADFDQPRVEAGVLLGGIKEPALGEYPVIAGGRITIRAWRLLDGEAEVSRYPIGGSASNYPATIALFGARAGRRFGNLGLYGKVRPGFISFDSNLNRPSLGTRPALNAGGILEFYSTRHLAARFDLGDTVVWYGRQGPGTRHQLQWSVGVSAWF